MASRVSFGPVREMGWQAPGLVPDANDQFYAALGAAFVFMAGGRATLAHAAQASLWGWVMQGHSVGGKRYSPANDEVVVPGGEEVKLFADSGGTIYYVPTSQAYVADTHKGARGALIGIGAPVLTGEVQLADLANAAATGVLRILDGDEGENAAYVAITPGTLQ